MRARLACAAAVLGAGVFFAAGALADRAEDLAALREAKQQGCHVMGICNVVGSTIARETHFGVYTHAGPEIGVASTKAFTTQIVAHYLLALKIGIARGTLDRERARERLQDLMRLPRLIESTL